MIYGFGIRILRHEQWTGNSLLPAAAPFLDALQMLRGARVGASTRSVFLVMMAKGKQDKFHLALYTLYKQDRMFFCLWDLVLLLRTTCRHDGILCARCAKFATMSSWNLSTAHIKPLIDSARMGTILGPKFNDVSLVGGPDPNYMVCFGHRKDLYLQATLKE